MESANLFMAFLPLEPVVLQLYMKSSNNRRIYPHIDGTGSAPVVWVYRKDNYFELLMSIRQIGKGFIPGLELTSQVFVDWRRR